MKNGKNCVKYSRDVENNYSHLREIIRALVKAHLASRPSALKSPINEGKEHD